MRVLFLSQRVPYPPDRGDKITTWRLVERLSRRHTVRVVAFAHDERDREAAATLRGKGIETVDVPLRGPAARAAHGLAALATGRPLTLAWYGSARFAREAAALAGGCDVGYAYSSSTGAFLLGRGLPWVMHMAELDSDKWRQYAAREAGPRRRLYDREHRTLERHERRLVADAATSVFCTPLEQRVFDERLPGHASVVLRNGVDLERFRPAPDRAEPGHLVFVGVMDYLPNVDGCSWFVREVLPRVRERAPETRFSIVGSRPTPAVRALGAAPGVTVTGFVDEPRDWLERAAVSVAPLRIARGIQNKVLEALAMGLPTVGTTSATQGVEGEPGRDFLVADDAPGFAAAVVRLLDDAAERRRVGAAGRALVERAYDWERVLDPLEPLLERVAGGAPGPRRGRAGRPLPCSAPPPANRPMSHERIAAVFDDWAASGRDASMAEGHSDVVAQILDSLDVRPGQKLLDLGCGNGWATRLLAKLAPGAGAVGVDVSTEMLAKAEELHSYTIRARYERMPFEALDFPDASFDRIFSMESIYYAADLDAALAEAFRVLKPGGEADFVVDFYADSTTTAVWAEHVGLPMHHLSTAQWVAALERAGFTGVEAQRVVDSRGPGDEADFTPSRWFPTFADRRAAHEAGSLWLRARKA